MSNEIRYIRYEEFGAVGDGKVNDYKALYRAHEYANENNCVIKAEAGKNYYISHLDGGNSIPIRTDVIWTGASFTIDDSEILPDDSECKKSIFTLTSDYPALTLDASSEELRRIVEAGGIKTTTKKLPISFGYPAMLIPYDDTHKVYIRYGANQNAGQSQHEVIVIDAEGNIDKDTPALLDYNNITRMLVYRIDDKPITVDGGVFITVANRAPAAYTYYSRNISILRSNSTLKNLEHRIVAEGPHGAPYSGFVRTGEANNLIVEGCVFQAHKTYLNLSGIGGKTWMGTYEIGGANSNNICYKNCRQSNFYKYQSDEINIGMIWYNPETGETDTRNDGSGALAYLWGVMGTNYCKNITYDGCILNRFDAHAGLYNAAVKNSKIMNINLIGGGTALISNTCIYYRLGLNLRRDYGSTWHGDFILDDVTIVTDSPDVYLIYGDWTNWDFGYKTYLPRVSINKLKLVNPSPNKEQNFYVFSEFATEDFHAERVLMNAERYPDELDCDGKAPNKNKQSVEKLVKITNSPEISLSVAPSTSALNGKIFLA